MACKMRLFQNVEKMYQVTGIQKAKLLESTSISSLNWKICLVLMSQMLLFSSTAAFLLFKANSVAEYGAAFSGGVMIFANVLYFILNIWKMPRTMELIAEFEDFVEKSINFDLNFVKKKCSNSTFISFKQTAIGMDRPSSMTIYIEVNDKVERVSKWAYFLLLSTSLGGCGLCAILISYINYYIFDLEDGSFLVPTPLM